MPISSSLIWWFSLHLAKSTSNEASGYIVFSNLLSLHPSSVKIFSSLPRSKTSTLWNCILPYIWGAEAKNCSLMTQINPLFIKRRSTNSFSNRGINLLNSENKKWMICIIERTQLRGWRQIRQENGFLKEAWTVDVTMQLTGAARIILEAQTLLKMMTISVAWEQFTQRSYFQINNRNEGIIM
jgi:hypothetical protein